MADTVTFDIFDDKGTKVLDGKPSPDVLSSLNSNTTLKGYTAAYAGKDAKLALPDMITKPGKPSLAVTGDDGKATYTVTPATGDGDTPRTYTVSYSADGKTFTNATGTETTGEVMGLTNGTDYTFKAVTNNSDGSSTVSDTVTVTPAASKPKLGDISTTDNSATINLS
ncbi:fibronectin type III domain-containing protein [Levilactobacillus andaensis]|uniref:fibronectin type III domain-containing protein n=1 Tax=Levilactobacillus andaensis TaxID=2799570 RepID=UPI0019457CCD|nr:fibronectin type III domain-containing protein [Levilactobacillus andaensis]